MGFTAVPRKITPMNQAAPALPAERTETARVLAQALGSDEARLAGVLLEAVDRLGVLLSIKEAASGHYVHANARMAELFGCTLGQLLGMTDTDLLQPAPAATLRAAEQAAMAHATPTASEHRIEREGKKREFSVTRIAVPRADGAPARHVLALWVERTEAHQRESQLRQALVQIEQQQVSAEALRAESRDQRRRDDPASPFQHQHFDEQLRREVDLSSREHREFALVSISIDPLSDAALAHGEPARARVLEAISRLLRGNTRAMDASCRLDVHRFAVLLSGVGLATAHSRMEGLRRQCATQIVVHEGQDLGFTVSMGVASFPHTAHSEAELLGAADTALEEAQKRGGNHVALASIRFDPGHAG